MTQAIIKATEWNDTESTFDRAIGFGVTTKISRINGGISHMVVVSEGTDTVEAAPTDGITAGLGREVVAKPECLRGTSGIYLPGDSIYVVVFALGGTGVAGTERIDLNLAGRQAA